MNIKRILSLSLLLAVLISGCTVATPTPEYMPDGAEKDAVIAEADVFIQNIVTGIQTNDMAIFAKDFDDAMLSAMKQSSFDQLAKTYGPLGAPDSIELLNVQIAGDFFAVRYTVTYPEKTLIYRVVVNKESPRKVSGLWFD